MSATQAKLHVLLKQCVYEAKTNQLLAHNILVESNLVAIPPSLFLLSFNSSKGINPILVFLHGLVPPLLENLKFPRRLSSDLLSPYQNQQTSLNYRK